MKKIIKNSTKLERLQYLENLVKQIDEKRDYIKRLKDSPIGLFETHMERVHTTYICVRVLNRLVERNNRILESLKESYYW